MLHANQNEFLVSRIYRNVSVSIFIRILYGICKDDDWNPDYKRKNNGHRKERPLGIQGENGLISLL
jgi:hypothetical protein